MTTPAGRTWVLDLDGVIWRGRTPVPGSAEAVKRLRARSDRVLFATNHSAPTRCQLLDKLAGFGIAADADDLVTSADAAASLVAPGERVHAFAGHGVVEALERRGAHVAHDGATDAVVIGWHGHLDLSGLTRAVRAVLDGARVIATNDDPLRPSADGLCPGTGAFLAAVEAATGATAIRAGKPHTTMAAVLAPKVTGEVIVVGDSPRTDGGLATALDARFGLVLTGVTAAAPTSGRAGWVVSADLATLVSEIPPR